VTQPTIFAPQDRAVALIIHDGKLVLIRRQKQGHEYYVLPGGSIEVDETPAVACIREVQEETGLIGTASTYLCTWSNQGRAEHYFLVRVKGGKLVLGGPERDRSTVDNQYTPLWIEPAQIKTLNLQPPAVHDLILRHLQDPQTA
jgi:ADP-ribose pyrophosphatase YjhB (NUDIX family)